MRQLKLPEIFVNRVKYGYGVLITDTPNTADLDTHWSSGLNLDATRIFRKTENTSEARSNLAKIQQLISVRESFLCYTAYRAKDIYRFSTTAAPQIPVVELCCLMDLHKSVAESDAYCFRYDRSPFPEGELPLTPIETYLRLALDRAKINYEMQVQVGKYVVDFLVNSNEQRVVVEADGKQYHVPERDSIRDRVIKDETGLDTLRFGGSKIVRNADQCANEILEYFKKVRPVLSAIMKEDEDKLDGSQINAIGHTGGPARVLAPAGSGKTKVLINRVVELINRGINPRGILCLTFDRKARTQLSTRLTDLGVTNRRPTERDKHIVTVATFNSLGNSILTQAIAVQENFTQFKVIDYRLTRSKFLEVLNEAATRSNTVVPPQRNRDPWSSWIDGMAQVKRALRDVSGPDCVTVPFYDEEGAAKEQEIGPFLKDFDGVCVANGLLTFDDQIYQATKNLLSDCGLRHQLQNKFSHILVDEYQDLNPAQIALLRLISARNQEVFCVGDDDQLIYSWRQVSPDNIVNFDQVFEGMTEYLLSINYRSSKEVIHRSQNVIRWNEGRIEKNVKAGPNNPLGSVDVYAGSSIIDQLKGLVANIKLYKDRHDSKYSDIAILSRVKACHLRIARALDQEDIPRQKILDVTLYSASVTQQLKAYLEICFDPKSAMTEHFEAIINKPNRYLTNKFVKVLSRSKSPYEFLQKCLQKKKPDEGKQHDEVEHSHQSKPVQEVWRNKHLADFMRQVDAVSKGFKELKPADAIDRIVSEFVFVPVVESVGASADEADAQTTIEIVREDAKGFSDLREFIDYIVFMEEAEIEGSEGLGIDPQNEELTDFVSISTIHGAKGREWDNVILFDCAEETRRREEQVSAEERRVFYVGMTRAKTNLMLLTRAEHPFRMIKDAFVPKEIRNDAEPSKKVKDQVAASKKQLTKLTNDKRRITQGISQLNEMRKAEKSLRKETNAIRKDRQDKRQNLKTGGLLSRVASNTVSESRKESILSGLSSEETRLKSQISEINHGIEEIEKSQEQLPRIEKEIEQKKQGIKRLEKIVPILELYDAAPTQ